MQQLEKEDFERITVSFYKYVIIKDPSALRKKLFINWNDLKVKGRIYIAKEGINAQLSCPKPNWDRFVKSVNLIQGLKNTPFKMALEEKKNAFLKLTKNI